MRPFIYPALSSFTEKSGMQMLAWLLLLSSCSSWCTRRRWWKTRPPACLCWRFRLQIQTWELMAKSPTPSTVLMQTSSISTTGQVWWCLFGVKHKCSLLVSCTECLSWRYHRHAAVAQKGSVLKRAKNISIISFFPIFSCISLTSPMLCFYHNIFLLCLQGHPIAWKILDSF